MPEAKQTKIFELSTTIKLIFSLLLMVFVVTGLTTFWLLNSGNDSQPLVSIVTALGLFSGIGLLLMFYLSWRHFSQFLYGY